MNQEVGGRTTKIKDSQEETSFMDSAIQARRLAVELKTARK